MPHLVIVPFVIVADDLGFSGQCSYSTDNFDLLLYIDPTPDTSNFPTKIIFLLRKRVLFPSLHSKLAFQ